MAGRQGFELGARPGSNVVMARGFWFQALETQVVTLFPFVHCRPPASARVDGRCGDILEPVATGIIASGTDLASVPTERLKATVG